MDRSNTRTNERNVQSDSHSEGALHGRTSRSRTRRDRPRARRRDTETQNYYWWQNNFQNTNETEVETEEEQVNIDRYDNQIHYDYTPASVRNNCWKDTDADEQGLEYLGRLPEMF